MAIVDILVPTRNRPDALAITLTALQNQTWTDFTIIIADQSDDEELSKRPPISTVIAWHETRGRRVQWLRNLPRQGMAQQRQFLLERATAPYCLFLDDDVLLEPFVLRLMLDVIQHEQCGFVGQGLIGLSYVNDVRPDEEAIELWDGPVRPEAVVPDSSTWERARVHNAANLWHVQLRLVATPQQPLLYKLAWCGGCVLYDRQKLLSSGGFSFWQELPPEHAGEDVLAELRVMKRYGGCGILPSGAYHQELPTTIANRKVDAPKCLRV